MLHLTLAVMIMLEDLSGVWTNDFLSVSIVAATTLHGMLLDGMAVGWSLELLRSLLVLGLSLMGLSSEDPETAAVDVGTTRALIMYSVYGAVMSVRALGKRVPPPCS
jgi:hypothetical protein